MFNPISFKDSQYSRLFLTSDTHFCHDKDFLFTKRGFSNIEEHNKVLVERWNDAVRDEDVVIHLGDFILGAGDKSVERAYEFLEKLNGKMFLLWGNHNAGVKTIYKKEVEQRFGRSDIEVYPLQVNNKLTFVGNNMLAKVTVDPASKMSGKSTYFVFCSHFAHRIWIDGNKGVLHACGHSHGSDKESNPDFLESKRLDVGIENFGRPIHFNEFLNVMNQKTFKILDHHDANTTQSF